MKRKKPIRKLVKRRRQRKARAHYRLKGPYEAKKWRLKRDWTEHSMTLALIASEKALTVLAALCMDMDWGGDEGMRREAEIALEACKQVARHRQNKPWGEP